MATPTRSNAEPRQAEPDIHPFHHDHPTLEEIAQEAYAIYMANGERHGNDFGDWLEAERRLRERRTQRA